MGTSPSFPITAAAKNDDIPTSKNDQLSSKRSATVVLLGLPQPELVSLTNQQVPQIINAARQNCLRTYMTNAKPTSSPYVEAKDTKAGGDTSLNDDDDDPFPGMFPGSSGNGSGSGSDVHPDDVADTFQLEHIGGLDEQKAYLQRAIILPLACPDVLKEWGMSPPKGILLHGPPGTGKTFMAKALVNELKRQLNTHVNFFYRKGGDVFSMWFGESQRKLREVFDTAKTMSPSIIFFDEIDGLCPSRDGSHNHGTEAYASVVTCFLGQMDSLQNGKVFVIAATNRLDAVDPAVRRPGRFDKHLAFGFPDEAARRKIIEIHTSKWSRNDQPERDLVDLLAQRTMGFSGADLEKLCKDVVYTAIEANGGVVNDNLRVTEYHWRQAMGSMQRTAVNAFGSYLYMPTKPTQIVSQLIQPTVEKVLQRIEPTLNVDSLKLDSSKYPWLCKSFLITINHVQSKSFLNDQILQGILSNSLFNKMSLFELSTSIVTNKVLSGAKPSIMAVIQDVMNQVQEAQQSENCAVLFVPNMNELLDIGRANHISSGSILKAIAKTRGPKMFLLATSSAPLDEVQDARMHELFSLRYMAAYNPSEVELQQFFQFVVASKKQAFGAQSKKVAILNEVSAKAAKMAATHNYEDILTLASALGEVDMENGTEIVIEQQFTGILNSYSSSRLR